MSSNTADARGVYDSRSVALHWATAFLIVGQWLGAHAIDWFPRGPVRVDARSVHILIGLLLLAIVLVRLIWRQTRAQRPEPTGPKAVRALTPMVHWTLYGLIIAVLTAGVVNGVVRGDSIFGLFNIPAYHPGDKPLRAQVGSIHELLANVLLMVAGVHAVAAVIHGWMWRDGVLGRMIPSLRPRKIGPPL